MNIAQLNIPVQLDDQFKKMIYSDKELQNIGVAEQFIRKSFSQQNKGVDWLNELCNEDAKQICDSFPKNQTIKQAAQSIAKVMECLPDFHVVKYDTLLAKQNWVCIRSISEASHTGKPFKNIQPSGKVGKWVINDFIEIDPNSGKISTLLRELDKHCAFTQLGWPIEEDDIF